MPPGDDDRGAPPRPAPNADVAGPSDSGRLLAYEEYSASAFRGPLPPAEVFAAYEAAVPGTGLRLVRLVEKEQEESWRFKRRGQIFGFTITIIGMGCATWLIQHGQSVYGLVFVVVALTPIVGGFIGRVLRAVEAKLLSKLLGTVPRPE